MRESLAGALADLRVDDLPEVDEADLSPDTIRERLRRTIKTHLNGHGDDLLAMLDKPAVSR